MTDASVERSQVRFGTTTIDYRIARSPRRSTLSIAIDQRHSSHDRAFWAALGCVMPDYEQRKARLRELGRSLLW
jgi:hypothetical protein